MTDLEWTEEPPREEGLYLCANPKFNDGWWFTVERVEYGEDVNGQGFTGWVVRRPHNLYKPIQEFAHGVMWQGPFPEPSDSNE